VEKMIAPEQNTTPIAGLGRITCTRGWGKRAIKKLLLGSFAFVALIVATGASAADVGLPVNGRALLPEWNWSGFDAGLNAGHARGRADQARRDQ
jgi:hypothetical protein